MSTLVAVVRLWQWKEKLRNQEKERQMNPKLEFEELPGHIKNPRVSKAITTPKGNQFRAVLSGSAIMLVSEANPNNPIIVTGGTTSAPLLGKLWDILGEAVEGLVKLLACKPVTTTTVETHKDGTVKVTMTTKCAD